MCVRAHAAEKAAATVVVVGLVVWRGERRYTDHEMRGEMKNRENERERHGIAD
jgi:hypothetical protein